MTERESTQFNSEAFAYFYCNRDEPDRRKPEIIMSTIVKQLAALSPEGPLQSIIIQEYESRKAKYGAASPLNFTDAYNLAKTLCDLYPQSSIVVDALDECDQHSRHDLLHALHDLAANSSSLVKIFVTSRLDEDITAIFKPKGIPTIELDTNEDREQDISQIVQDKVEEAFTSRGLLSGKLTEEETMRFKSQMVTILVRRAEGM